jgi:hypothetical protein
MTAGHYTDKYLDDAKLAGVHSVTLIHGKGTGALRRALWDQLKKDPRVKSYRLGAYGEGDAGVTVGRAQLSRCEPATAPSFAARRFYPWGGIKSNCRAHARRIYI